MPSLPGRPLPLLLLLLLLLLLPPCGPGALAQSGGAPGSETLSALMTVMTTERELLREDLQRYELAAARRARAMARLGDLHRTLDVAVRRTDGDAPAAVRRLMDQIEAAERERIGFLATERLLVERIADRQRRTQLLEQEIARLHGEVSALAGALSGDWNVTLMPGGQKGRFVVRQSGTVLSGTYTLDGGWTGSLQGTLVERKVYLVRIDSKLGRSMEFEGYLSADGSRIRGTWLSYELSADGSRGDWVALRAEEP